MNLLVVMNRGRVEGYQTPIIDNFLALGSYQDYRFRAPNLLLFEETFEHSIWGPFGVKFMGDQGRL
jgi:hypothetical protein